MPEPTVPPVTDAAVEAARRILGMPQEARSQVLLALATAAPHMVPPPALPTTAGALVIAATGGQVQGGVTLCLGASGYWRTLDGSEHFLPADIGAWVPAEVVPADAHGPVAVLRHIAEQLTSRPSIKDVDDLIADAQILIGVCLERLDGES